MDVPDGPLRGLRFVETGSSRTAGYAGRLLASLGAEVSPPRTPGRAPWYDAGKAASNGAGFAGTAARGVATGAPQAGSLTEITAPDDPEPLTDWARSGSLFLRGGTPEVGPGRLPAHLRGAALASQLLGFPVPIAGDQLPGDRAALRGGTPAPSRCRIHRAADGFVAVNLARPDDLDLVPAWLGLATGAEVTPLSTPDDLAALLAELPSALAADTAAELGLAVARVATAREAATDAQARSRGTGWPPMPWVVETVPGPRVSGPRTPPYVVDLTSLWAGPLTTSLLAAAGATVVKVEGPNRPDGARGGDARFFDLLNAGKRAVALDLRTEPGRRGLGLLLDRADVVVESLRPRVTEQLGIDPRAWLAARPGRVWASITGYGRSGPWRNRVAFGDDAAAAAGVAMLAAGPDGPRIVGDALADPVAGLHALVAILAARVDGRSHLIDISLRAALGHAIGDVDGDPECGLPDLDRLRRAGDGWLVDGDASRPAVMPPGRVPTGRARDLGADTDAVLGDG